MLQGKLFAAARTVPRNLARFSSSRIGQSAVAPRNAFGPLKYSTATPLTTPPTTPLTTPPTTPLLPTSTPKEAAVSSIDGLLPDVQGSDGTTDWSRSYHGLSATPFAPEVAEVLLTPIDPKDVEMKPGEY